MKLSEKSKKLLQVIREAVGEGEFTAKELMDRCAGRRTEEFPSLAAGLVVAAQFNVQRCACWLKRSQGAIVDGWRLCSDRGNRTDGPGRHQRWVYRFESLTEIGGAEMAKHMDVLDTEARIGTSTPGSRRFSKECDDQTERYFEREEEKVTREKLDEVNAEFARAMIAQRSREDALAATAAFNRVDVAPTAPEVMPEPKRAPAPPGTWRQPTKAELIARHNNSPGATARVTCRNKDGSEIRVWASPDAAGGLFNPGGVVQQAIEAEQSANADVHVCGRWPKFTGGV